MQKYLYIHHFLLAALLCATNLWTSVATYCVVGLLDRLLFCRASWLESRKVETMLEENTKQGHVTL